MTESIRNMLLDWYAFLSSLSAGATLEISALDNQIHIPLLSAFLLGLIGAAAPCQLSTGLGALAVLAQARPSVTRGRAVLAYLAGKALVYSALGVLAVAVGAGLAEISIPVFVMARRVLGPLMVVVGLAMAGVLRFRWTPGSSIMLRLCETFQRHANEAPFLLGAAFGFSFCPTLFALFFGVLVPLALSRPDGLVYPAAFALGTALPLLLGLGFIAIGGQSLRHSVVRISHGQRAIALVTGGLLVAAGLHDTAVYWFMQSLHSLQHAAAMAR